MPEDPWPRVKDLFQAALDREPKTRADFLAEACGDDLTLRDEVLSLLASHDEASGFLDGAALPGPSWEGRRVGAYLILGEVGRGGMGTVYRAVRDDDAFQRQVALKVVCADRGSTQLVNRFRVERQILARLDHPNIARLFDGGATEEGEPYLVMEYVVGRPIDAYCEDRALSTAARLGLFRAVCAAVHYAHQHLVVHRDIKPGNILVTADGVPKLLDFGIAKVLADDPTEAPTQTAFPALTPDYASPEQVRAQPVTTASDVYSLGVVLYEVLTGQRPYRVRTPVPAEIVRVVCELEPEKPSTIVRRARPTESKAATAPVPQTESETDDRRLQKLAGELEGDLDTIVLKALRKDPSRRYASAQELSDDLGRYLEGRPVLARADTLAYRATKFVRRHKAAVTAAALLFLSLVGGIVATASQARIAEANRQRAEKRFADVRTLARSFLFEIHDALRDLKGSRKARETIAIRALEYLDRLALEAGDDAALLEELAASYERLGDVQGSLLEPSLGDVAGAVASWRKAEALRARRLRAEPSSLDAAVKLAWSQCRLATGLMAEGRESEARETARQARSLLERSTPPKDEPQRLAVERACPRPGGQ
jgi:non-specific serine/threonine protein kinase/serine/threonine-protein kinase